VPADPAVETGGLHKSYGDVQALRGARALFLGIPAGNDVLLALAWTIGIIVVFAPLSAWRYRRVVAR